MERKCRYQPLSKQPLVLVLGQVRFSPIGAIADYIPAIQEQFRRHGFPLERAGTVRQVVFGRGADPSVQTNEQQRWEYRSKDETWSVLVMRDAVVLQTTSYTRFEEFADKLELASRTVLEQTEHDQFGVVQRVGLRYIDVVQPSTGKDFRHYLQSGLHGVPDEVFDEGTHRLHVQNAGRLPVGDTTGTLLIRIIQNDQGFVLPPDLLAGAPNLAQRTAPGELITLIDMDHFIEGSFEPDPEWIVASAYELHDHLVEAFFEQVVTGEAVEEWT